MGLRYNWTVKAWNAPPWQLGATSVVVNNVQQVNINYGRTQPTDDFPAGQFQLSGIFPDSLPQNFITVGRYVTCELVRNDNTKNVFTCKVQSLSRTYGTKPNLDSWTFNGVGLLSDFTKQQLTADYSTTAGATTIAAASALATTYGIETVGTTGSSTISAKSYTVGTYISDIMQELIRTEQGRLTDSVTQKINLINRTEAVTANNLATFVDGSISFPANFSTPYTSLEFLNNADYVANTVVVQPEGLASQTNGSGTPVLNFDTLDQSTTQAGNLANYIKNTLDKNTVRPYSITFLADAQTNVLWRYAITPGEQVRVDLRGTSFQCVVEGCSITGNPSVTQITCQLSSATAYQYLRLDDVTFGTLDNNRLGF